MSIASQIQRLKNAKQNMKKSLENKGIVVSETATLSNYSSLIDEIEINKLKFKEYNKEENGEYSYSTLASYIRSLPEIDLMGSKDASFLFDRFTYLEGIQLLNAQNIEDASAMFRGCSSLIALPEIEASNIVETYGMFSGCNELKDFGGLKNLGKGLSKKLNCGSNYINLDLSSCTKLTHASLMNIINKLYDLKQVFSSGTLYRQSIILEYNCYNLLTTAEKNIAKNKGWDILAAEVA